VIARWIDLCAAIASSSSPERSCWCWPASGRSADPLDALPDISDVQVIIHTAWNEPPNVIEIRLPTRS